MSALMDDDGAPLSLLGRALPARFRVRVVTVDAGQDRAYDHAEWRDAMVVVERGTIELELASGSRQRFGPGATLWLAGLPLRALHNPGPGPAVLAAVSRRGAEPETASDHPNE